MDVVIAGAGSIGLLMGSFLSEAGMDVTFYVRRKEQEELIRAKGIRRMQQGGIEKVFYPRVITDIRELPDAPWIIAVKSDGVQSLLSRIQEEKITQPVLFVQNGIGHLELVKKTDLPYVAFATVEHGARRVDDRTVSHNGIGKLVYAVFRGEAGSYEFLKRAHTDSFPVAHHADAEQILMRKVLINCMINPLTAVLGMENGALLTNDYCLKLFKTLYAELLTAFPEMEPVLPYEAVADVCRKTACNQSSMFVDRLAGRPMEIETIVSAVRKKAEGRSKELPLLTTLESLLYAMDRKGVRS